jgi:hypothetical protein
MKPYPVVVTTICSLCGLPWDDHGDKPTAEDCVRLLLVELAKTPTPLRLRRTCCRCRTRLSAALQPVRLAHDHLSDSERGHDCTWLHRQRCGHQRVIELHRHRHVPHAR